MSARRLPEPGESSRFAQYGARWQWQGVVAETGLQRRGCRWDGERLGHSEPVVVDKSMPWMGPFAWTAYLLTVQRLHPGYIPQLAGGHYQRSLGHVSPGLSPRQVAGTLVSPSVTGAATKLTEPSTCRPCLAHATACERSERW